MCCAKHAVASRQSQPIWRSEIGVDYSERVILERASRLNYYKWWNKTGRDYRETAIIDAAILMQQIYCTTKIHQTSEWYQTPVFQ